MLKCTQCNNIFAAKCVETSGIKPQRARHEVYIHDATMFPRSNTHNNYREQEQIQSEATRMQLDLTNFLKEEKNKNLSNAFEMING